MKFVACTSTLLLVFTSVISGTTFAQVKTDVDAIESAVSALNQQLQANSLSYLSALSIHSASVAVDDKIKAGTTDVQGLTETPTEADTTSLIDTLTSTEVNVKSATDRLIALKSQFDTLGVTAIAKGDINNIKTDTAAFGAALVNDTPDAQKAQAQTLADKFNADLANAAAAYN